MKIVLIGDESDFFQLIEELCFLGFSNVVCLPAQKYEIKSDDCVILEDKIADDPEIFEIFSLKLREQQPLKIWTWTAFKSEIEKFGYKRNDHLEELSQILHFLFTGKKLPYEVIR